VERSFRNGQGGSLEGLRGWVYGAGPLGLFTSFALAYNGAGVTLAAADPIERGIGFHNAAGLFEPVASDDSRGPGWLQAGMAFCEWAHRDDAWGIEPRRVLFLADDEARVTQNWMVDLPSYRRATAQEIDGRRKYGAWFDTYVIQPDIAIDAVRRELRRLKIIGPKTIKVNSASMAASKATKAGADFFVLALGLGLADIADIEHVAGVNAMMSAGIGVTIVLPYDAIGLDYVIMDDGDLGYLIPQRTHVIGGSTLHMRDHDHPDARAIEPDPRDINIVRGKIERLWSQAATVHGESRVGSRPLRAGGQVLTARLEQPNVAIPGFVLGGAGGSGWTFATGIADDAVAEIARYLECSTPLPLVPYVPDDFADTGDAASGPDPS
jgi:glycine/D-amino acid oxidase-like deaminating enzyme